MTPEDVARLRAIAEAAKEPLLPHMGYRQQVALDRARKDAAYGLSEALDEIERLLHPSQGEEVTLRARHDEAIALAERTQAKNGELAYEVGIWMRRANERADELGEADAEVVRLKGRLPHVAGEEEDRCEFTGFSGHQCLYQSGHDSHLVDQLGGRAVISPIWPDWEAGYARSMVNRFEALPEENATGSRDFGRGYAQAIKDCTDLVRGLGNA